MQCKVKELGLGLGDVGAGKHTLLLGKSILASYLLDGKIITRVSRDGGCRLYTKPI